MGFLDTSVLRWFLKPYFVAGRLTLKVATRTGAFALELADRFLGHPDPALATPREPAERFAPHVPIDEHLVGDRLGEA